MMSFEYRKAFFNVHGLLIPKSYVITYFKKYNNQINDYVDYKQYREYCDMKRYTNGKRLYTNYDNINLDNITYDIEILIIDELYEPLTNLPITLKKIVINKQINVFTYQHKIPFDCKVIIKNTEINNIKDLNNLKESNYNEITKIYLIYKDTYFDGYTSTPLDKIPEKIFNLTNLKNLTICSHYIKEIPFQISNLTNLTKLNLEDNPIVIVSKNILLLKNLKSLNLSNFLNKNIDFLCEIRKVLDIKKIYNIDLRDNVY